MLTKPPVGTRIKFLGYSGFEDHPETKRNLGKIGVVVESPSCFSLTTASRFLDARFDGWCDFEGNISTADIILCGNDEFEVVE